MGPTLPRHSFERVLVFGGASDIAVGVIAELGEEVRLVRLVDVDADGLQVACRRLASSGRKLECVVADLASGDLEETLSGTLGNEGWDLVVVAAGVLGSRDHLVDAEAALRRLVDVNLLAFVLVAIRSASHLDRTGGGGLALITSTAGVRARRSNLLYAATKAGADVFARGLADAYSGSRVRVSVIRPGFVFTKMTSAVPAAPLAIPLDRAARDIARGLRRGRGLIWTPRTMVLVSAAIRATPRGVWRRLEPRLGSPR